MEEIAALQQELALASAAPSTRRTISPATTITLITKIQKLSLLPPLIFPHTRDCYITSQHLSSIILSHLETHRGRLTIPELSTILSISPSHITDSLPPLLTSTPPKTILLNNTLLTPTYTTSLIHTIAHDLLTSPNGRLSLPDIASNHNLPLSYIRTLISTHIQNTTNTTTSIPGTLSKDFTVLLTSTAAHRDRVIAIAALRATTRPTLLSTLAKAYDVEEDLFCEVIRSKETNVGVVEQGVFEPFIYRKARERRIVEVWKQSGYVNCEDLQGLGKNEKDGGGDGLERYVRTRLGAFVRVESGFVAKSVVENVGNAAKKAEEKGSWVDVAAALPMELSNEDIGAVVEMVANDRWIGEEGNENGENHERNSRTSVDEATEGERCQRSGPLGISVDDRYIVSHELLQKLEKVLEDDAAVLAKDLYQKSYNTTTSSAGEVEARYGGLNSGGNGRKKGKRREKGSRKQNADNLMGSTGNVVPSEARIHSVLTMNSKIQQLLSCDILNSRLRPGATTADRNGYGIDEGARDSKNDDVLRTIVSCCLLHQAPTIYRGAIERHKAEAENEAEAERARTVNSVLKSLYKAQVYEKGARSLPVSLQNASKRHVLNSLVQATLDILIIIANAHLGLGIDPKSRLTLKQTIRKLPPDIVSMTRPLTECSSLEEYMATYDALCTKFELGKRIPFNESTESSIASAIESELISVLESGRKAQEADESLAALVTDKLRAAAELVYMSCNKNTIIAIPPAAVLKVCSELKSNPSQSDAVIALMDLKQASMNFLKCIDAKTEKAETLKAWQRVQDATNKLLNIIR